MVSFKENKRERERGFKVREFNVDNLVVLKSLVRCLELVSGLKVNIHKSRFGGLGVARE